MVNDCFDSMEQLLLTAENFVNECTSENEDEIKEIINKIQWQIYILRHGVVDYAQLFDKKLFKQIKEETERLEDGVTQGIQSCYLSGNSVKKELSNLQKYKYAIISKIYKYDMKEWL